MKKVLITGASGFIGINVVEEFIQRDCFVYAIVNNNINPILKKFENQKKLLILKLNLNDYQELFNAYKKIDNMGL